MVLLTGPDRIRTAAFAVGAAVVAVAVATVAWADGGSTVLPIDAVADRVVVLKSKRTLTLYHAGTTLKTYAIALGKVPTGPKRFEGDLRTPEGLYTIDFRKPDSDYHRALHISYPNASDRAYAAARDRSAGGDIMIHGLPNGYGYVGAVHRFTDWTNGCIAVTDEEIEELWRAVPNGTPIELKP